MTALTDERIISLIKEGAHYSLIGERLGLTRNAVSGRVRRMKERGVVIPFPIRWIAASKPPAQQDKITAKVTKPVCNPITSQHKGIGTRLVELPPNSCMYPTGYNGEHLFCGAPRRDLLTSYCEPHHKIVWVKSRNK